MVMTSGVTSVLLTEAPEHGDAEIEVWGPAHSATVQVLEAAPIELDKQPCDAPAALREGNGVGDGLWDPTLGG